MKIVKLVLAVLLVAMVVSSLTAQGANWNSSGLHSAAPVMGACGTTPTVSGTDNNFKVTVGTGGAATSCAVTFGSPFVVAPTCITQNDTDKVSYSIVTTTSTVTVSATAAFTASSKLHILCFG